MRSKSGGGITGKNVREVGYRTGKGAMSKNPGKVAQLGSMVGDHITDRRASSGYRGEPWTIGPSFDPKAFGNEIAVVTKCGPGGSREVMRTGSQGQHGAANPGNPTPVKKTQLEDFGPDSAIVRTRK
jgi:hypothetical protein